MRFCTAKFRSFLLAGTVFAVFGFLNRLADAVIVGHVIGEDALAGVQMVLPALLVVSFFAAIVSMGAATNYAIWMGRLDRRRARAFATVGLCTAAVVGAALSAILYFGEDLYLGLLGGAEYVDMYGRQYMDWIWSYGLVHCLLMLATLLVCADGDLVLCAVANGFVLALNVAVSYLSVERGMGASGCALGTVASEGVGLAVLGIHLLRSSNSLALARGGTGRDVWPVLRAGFGEAVPFLFDAALFFCLCKTVIVRFGSDFLPVAGVAIIVWRFSEIANGVGLALQPLVTVYWGERNFRGVRSVMRAALTAAPLEGLALAVLLTAAPDLVIRLLGVEYPELVDASRSCVRHVCWALVPLAFAGLFKSYFLFVERPILSCAVSAVCNLAFPALCLTAGAAWGGFGGLCDGLTAGAALALAALALFLLVRHGRAAFPFLLPAERDGTMRTLNLVLTEEEIVQTSKAVAESVPESFATRAALMVEEVFMTVRERNPNRRRLLGEVTLDFRDGVAMTLRDDGVIFDITDADARISSLRTYLVASVMERHRERLNLVTTGFNRNVFRFA